MRTELTQDQIEFYRENGFIVLDEFLDGGELEEWREAVDETVHKRGMYLDPENGARKAAIISASSFSRSTCGKKASASAN